MPVDENLPTFYLKSGKAAHQSTIYLIQYGDDPNPAYSLRYPDPSTPESKNRYAAALYDPYVPDVVYGEVLIIPEWTQPTLSADAVRQNGGFTPPPEPILPSSFTIHLYNPDQQVTVHYKTKTWNTPATWTFEMPQHSFRQPTGSSLDRVQIDPAVADTTPKLRFSWRKDSKLSKDITCLLSGKTTAIPDTKTKSKEPDITVSIFKSLRELTLYEPNLYRVEMEDFKGLELVLLLGALTIRDVYFTAPKDAFRVARKTSTSSTYTSPPSASNSPTITTTPPPLKDLPPAPASQQQQVKNAQHCKQQEQQRKEEERRTKKLLEEEEKARRKREAEIEKETRRLQKLYGEEERKARAQAQTPKPTPALPPRHQQQQQRPAQRYYDHNQPFPVVSHGGSRPYMQLPGQGMASTTTLLAPPGPGPAPRPQLTVDPSLQPKRSSFFGRRRTSEDGKLMKKRSSMF